MKKPDLFKGLVKVRSPLLHVPHLRVNLAPNFARFFDQDIPTWRVLLALSQLRCQRFEQLQQVKQFFPHNIKPF